MTASSSGASVDTGLLPRHIAIIMDGNGRWATARGLSRAKGHRHGIEAAQKTVEAAKELGIEYVTLFSFSSENWNRPQDEIDDLMDLLRYYLRKETAELHKTGARLRVIGDRDRLPDDIVGMIENAENVTLDNTEINVTIALSYGGRQDIVYAARRIAEAAAAGDIDPARVDEDMFDGFLMTADIPDPDLVIRTSGESRISNFLLWQSAYTELYFTDTLWPDFSCEELEKALEFYAQRERRYGALPARSDA